MFPQKKSMSIRYLCSKTTCKGYPIHEVINREIPVQFWATQLSSTAEIWYVSKFKELHAQPNKSLQTDCLMNEIYQFECKTTTEVQNKSPFTDMSRNLSGETSIKSPVFCLLKSQIHVLLCSKLQIPWSLVTSTKLMTKQLYKVLIPLVRVQAP